ELGTGPSGGIWARVEQAAAQHVRQEREAAERERRRPAGLPPLRGAVLGQAVGREGTGLGRRRAVRRLLPGRGADQAEREAAERERAAAEAVAAEAERCGAWWRRT
ncbi:hypothetical protein, partial [Streptomyces tateyamensis]|uniref:hypothetical protein n=1 Tax=Streptomyces tateyamensis TaxID=565073 RepID=UPI001C65255C